MLPEHARGAAPYKSDPELHKDQHSNYRTDRAFWSIVWCALGALSVAQIAASLWTAAHA